MYKGPPPPPKSDLVHTMVMLTAARIGDLFGSTVAVDESPTGAEVDFQDLREEAELETRYEIRQEALRFALEEGEKESIAQEETEDAQISQKLNRRKKKKLRARLRSSIRYALSSLRNLSTSNKNAEHRG